MIEKTHRKEGNNHSKHQDLKDSQTKRNQQRNRVELRVNQV